MEGIASIWQNQCWWYVNYGNQEFTASGTVSSMSFAITNNSTPVVMIMGVQVAVPYSETYDDYGGFGITRNFTLSGSVLMPLYNNQFPAPNYGTWANGSLPYATYNSTYGGVSGTVTFPSPLTNPTIIVIYCEIGGSDQPSNTAGGKKGGGGIPLQQPGLTFERSLGAGASGNPQTFSEYSGIGGANIPLGASPELPFLNFEVKALFGLGNDSLASTFNPATGGYSPAVASGDCNPADIILDIITSGNRTDAITANANIIWQHGLSLTGAVSPNNSEFVYSRYGSILTDESTLWEGGSNLGLNAMRDYCMAYGMWHLWHARLANEVHLIS